MSHETQSQAPPIPPEYRLPVVTQATIDQYRADPIPFESSLVQFTRDNQALLGELRIEATRLFPSDLEGRKRAFSLLLSGLCLVQGQQIHDTLNEQFVTLEPAVLDSELQL